MKQSYGEVILKKGSILYHTSNELFSYKPEFPMLFCTFHPSEWFYNEEYISFISLKKDISLFFMIDFSNNSKSYSSLPKITDNYIHLLKITHTLPQLLYYSNELKNNNFDGWFNSNVIDKSFIEVCLLNDNTIFEVLKCNKLIKDWSRHNNAYNIITQKKWGTKYPIEKNIIFNLNKRYEEHIKKYLQNTMNNKFYLKYTLQILLMNARIYYHDEQLQEVKWNISNFH